jgi:fructose-1,6-bisphosphatase/inositol monophosphatase family enzyme
MISSPVHVESTSLHEAVRTVIVEAAERAIMPRFGRLTAGDIREKAADDLVTIADQESEHILAEGLARILPEAAIVGEEAAAADVAVLNLLGQSLSWIVDPLDGTGNFAAGEGPFGVLVALADGPDPIGGWIYDPRTRRFCSAFRGEGAFIDGRQVRSAGSGSQPPIAAISSLFVDSSRRARVHQGMKGVFETVPIPRCAAEQYPRIVLGVNDVTLYERTLPWDHAAGALFLTEAGGRVSRFDGAPYVVGDDRRGLIAAATPSLWEQTLGLLPGLD